ncbi:MAG: phenylalanine--tRNA ligase subunit beta [Gemmatimonadota bacterium]|nr:phenylalanine--tRNA ligase subunit beta [Gemmatimonadota bacterium]
MNASYRWLLELVPGLDLDAEAVSEHLALRGAPVEDTHAPGASLEDVVVGEVLESDPHPNADRLTLCTVDGGDGAVQVVCGAPNVKVGARYPFAPVGAVLPGDFRIKKAKIRGEVSQGMLCSAKELGLGADHQGIMELAGDFEPGASFVEALGLDDTTLDVEVTANRGDLLSHLGLARELAPAGEGRVVLPELPGVEVLELEYRRDASRVEGAGVAVEVREPALCPRYLGAIVRNVTVGPSPAWLQRRLRGTGARPINNVVDATNYVMLELGQPLHAFDLGKLSGSEVVVRQPESDEVHVTTLDGERRALSADMLMICDAEHPVAIAGVMGGLDSEVDEATTDLFLECAWFDPKSIRATRRALGMSTDASYRFERGIDPEGLERALARCASLIAAIAGGTVDGPVLDCGSPTYEADVVPLRLSRVERLLGVPFTGDEVGRLLEPLGFVLEHETNGTLHFRIPGFRSHDVHREVDLIEEVARSHGYDAFPSELGPYRPGTVPDHPLFRLEDELRGKLAARGLFEAQTPAFVPEGEGEVEVANPLATTEPFMRRTLLPSLLRRVEYNLARGNRDVRLFEFGTSFRKAESGAPPLERPNLAMVLTGRRRPVHWSYPSESVDVWDLKSLVEEVATQAYRGRSAVRVAQNENGGAAAFEPDSGFVVHDSDGSVVGRAGKVRDDLVDAPAWAGDVWGFELTLPDVPESAPVPTHVPLPQHPAVERDLALLVPDGVPAGTVLDTLRRDGGTQLEDVLVFDLYEGTGVPEGTRSIAFRLRFRDPERTLKDEEVDRVVERLLDGLGEEFGVRSRG